MPWMKRWRRGVASLVIGLAFRTMVLAGFVCGGLLVLAGCGDDGNGTDTSVALPGTKERLIEQYIDELDGSGVVPEVAECYENEIRALPDSFFEQFRDVEEGVVPPEILELNVKFRETCVPPGTPVLDPNATSDEIDKSRELVKTFLPDALKQQGASSAQIDCMVQQVDELSDEEVLAFSNSESGAQSIFRSMGAKCGGQ